MQPVDRWVISCEVSSTKRVMGLPLVPPPPPCPVQQKNQSRRGVGSPNLLILCRNGLEFPVKTDFPGMTSGSTGFVMPETSLDRVDEQEEGSPAPGRPLMCRHVFLGARSRMGRRRWQRKILI